MTSVSQKQLNLIRPRKEHGGEIRKGLRKLERPLDTKRAIHLTLRSSRARGPWSLLNPKHRFAVERRMHDAARKYGVKVYRFANVGNHLHILIKTRDRKSFQDFLREFSGRVAMMVSKARKGSPVGRFWDELAYSRVVEWGRDFKNVTRYFVKNLFEAEGTYGPREKARGLGLVWLSDLEANTGPP